MIGWGLGNGKRRDLAGIGGIGAERLLGKRMPKLRRFKCSWEKRRRGGDYGLKGTAGGIQQPCMAFASRLWSPAPASRIDFRPPERDAVETAVGYRANIKFSLRTIGRAW